MRPPHMPLAACGWHVPRVAASARVCGYSHAGSYQVCAVYLSLGLTE